MTREPITMLEFEKALAAMLDAVSAGRGAEKRYRRALLAAFNEIDLMHEAQPNMLCRCSPTEKMYCASNECIGGIDVPQWVERTWVDVRQGDIVRPPGIEGADAKVTAIGPVVAWGVNDIQPLDAYQQRDIQYNPGRYAGTYAVRKATLLPVSDDVHSMTRDMKPDAPVEIEMTASEVRDIELLGGWHNRV